VARLADSITTSHSLSHAHQRIAASTRTFAGNIKAKHHSVYSAIGARHHSITQSFCRCW